MTTVADLIKILETKVQTAEIEYVVVEKDGKLVTCDVKEQAKPMIKVLKMFGNK